MWDSYEKTSLGEEYLCWLLNFGLASSKSTIWVHQLDNYLRSVSSGTEGLLLLDMLLSEPQWKDALRYLIVLRQSTSTLAVCVLFVEMDPLDLDSSLVITHREKPSNTNVIFARICVCYDLWEAYCIIRDSFRWWTEKKLYHYRIEFKLHIHLQNTISTALSDNYFHT